MEGNERNYIRNSNSKIEQKGIRCICWFSFLLNDNNSWKWHLQWMDKNKSATYKKVPFKRNINKKFNKMKRRRCNSFNFISFLRTVSSLFHFNGFLIHYSFQWNFFIGRTFILVHWASAWTAKIIHHDDIVAIIAVPITRIRSHWRCCL